MSPISRWVAVLALSLCGAHGAHAQSSGRLAWKERRSCAMPVARVAAVQRTHQGVLHEPRT